MKLFDQNRNYVLGDEELNLIGDRDKLAQWRHKGMGPAFYRLGRKIIYRGEDLNAWARQTVSRRMRVGQTDASPRHCTRCQDASELSH